MAWAGTADGPPVAGGADVYPWLPMHGAVVLGDFATLDNYITAVTDHGDGDLELTLDKTMQRTAPGNGDLLYLDLGQYITAEDAKTHVLQTRFTVVTRPTTLAGTPFFGLAHIVGSTARTGWGPVACMMLGAANDTARTTTLFQTALTAGTNTGQPAVWRQSWSHPVGPTIGQYGVDWDTDAGAEGWGALTTSTPPDEANLDTGYNQAGGQFYALFFSQLVAQGAGSDTLRLKSERRVVPRWVLDA